MAEPHVITALVAKYAELQGQLQTNEQEADRLRIEIAHVEATIRIFRHDADLSLVAPRMPRNRNPWFRKGHCIRAAIDVLRQSQMPMSAREIALRLLRERGITDANARSVKFLTSTIYGSLNRRKDGAVTVHGGGFPKRWSLITSSTEME
jgi:hypothetical protein